jgi:hypothetical protein
MHASTAAALASNLRTNLRSIGRIMHGSIHAAKLIIIRFLQLYTSAVCVCVCVTASSAGATGSSACKQRRYRSIDRFMEIKQIYSRRKHDIDMHTLASKQAVIHQVGQIYTAQLYIHMMIQHMHVSCNNETRSELQHPHERLLTANIMCTGCDVPVTA